MKLISITQAAKILNISWVAMKKRLVQIPEPEYLIVQGKKRLIDSNHQSFRILMQKKDAEAQPLPDDGGRAKSLVDLRIESQKAELELPIQKSELNRYKIEQERIELDKNSRKLIETSLADYLFTGYLSRVNREVLNIPKRISKEVELEIQAGVHGKIAPGIITKKIVKLFTREHEAILRNVIDQQKKEVEKWENEK